MRALKYSLHELYALGLGYLIWPRLGQVQKEIQEPEDVHELWLRYWESKKSNVLPLPGSTKKQVLERAQTDQEWMQKHHVKMLFPWDKDYPSSLLELPDRPWCIYLLGDPGLLNHEPVLAVVGTRKASAYGLDYCGRMVRELWRYAPMIASGMAYGIDSAAHTAALEADMPTLAVLGHGLKYCFPTSSRPLFKSLARQGALISEYPPGMLAQALRFVQRNRIISGLAQAVLLVESKRNGGAMHTVHFAQGYGREVLVLPGQATNPRALGPLHLLSEGAASPVWSGDQIAQWLKWKPVSGIPPSRTHAEGNLLPKKTGEAASILKWISEHPGIGTEALAQAINMPIAQIQVLLMQMELKGKIGRTTASGWILNLGQPA